MSDAFERLLQDDPLENLQAIEIASIRARRALLSQQWNIHHEEAARLWRMVEALKDECPHPPSEVKIYRDSDDADIAACSVCDKSWHPELSFPGWSSE